MGFPGGARTISGKPVFRARTADPNQSSSSRLSSFGARSPNVCFNIANSFGSCRINRFTCLTGYLCAVFIDSCTTY